MQNVKNTTNPVQTNSCGDAASRIAPPGLAWRILGAGFRVTLYERDLLDGSLSEARPTLERRPPAIPATIAPGR